MKKTKIICTLGPAVDDEVKLESLINKGMDVARFNFSHGDHNAQQIRVDRIKNVKKRHGKDIALLLDTKGPEIRIGKIADGTAELIEGELFTLLYEDVLGNNKQVSITHKELYKSIEEGKRILINDGLIELNVEKVVNKDIVCKVINGGIISDNKGVNIPDTDTNLPSLTSQDVKDIEFAIKNEFDFIAASFIRKAKDIIAVKEILSSKGASNIKVIAKIENREGVDNFDEILEVSDGIMVARGDLGVEIPFEEIPALQKMMCEKCNAQEKIVIVATQMLESMIVNPRPTRAEVSDVANAIYDGASAIMLSGESAAGKYPVESVETMTRIALETEKSMYFHARKKISLPDTTIKSEAISLASVLTANSLKASAIVCLTESGVTARKISFYKPMCPIIAITHDEKVVRNLRLAWGVYPVLLKENYDVENMFNVGIDIALREGLAKENDNIVITSGEKRSKKGSTNILKIHTV